MNTQILARIGIRIRFPPPQTKTNRKTKNKSTRKLSSPGIDEIHKIVNGVERLEASKSSIFITDMCVSDCERSNLMSRYGGWREYNWFSDRHRSISYVRWDPVWRILFCLGTLYSHIWDIWSMFEGHGFRHLIVFMRNDFVVFVSCVGHQHLKLFIVFLREIPNPMSTRFEGFPI